MVRPSRRRFLRHAGHALVAGASLDLALAPAPVAGQPAPGGRGGAAIPGAARFAYVGCFTSPERQARGEGISVYRIDPAGAWTLVQVVRGELNPSWLTIDPVRPCLYATHSDSDLVSAFRRDPATGHLALINRQPVGGRNPAHVALDPSGRVLVAANYVGGNVAVVPVGADGTLGARTDLVALTGDLGPHRTEQAVPHPHQCRFDPSGRVLAVPDKGLDRIFLFAVDAVAGTLRPLDPASVLTRAGAGPRHVAWHPTAPCAYAINELDSTVTTYRLEGPGRWTPVQILPSLPSTYTGANTGAAIEVTPSGRFVFASNRGHDSVAGFAVNDADGTLSPAGWTPTGGRVPRFVCIGPRGDTLLAANQASDTIVEFAIDARSGALTPTGLRVETGTPTAIAFGA